MNKTKVIMRMDDVMQLNFFELCDWFISNHPEIPIYCFLWRMHEWNARGWKKAKEMIEKYNWETGAYSPTSLSHDVNNR